MYDLHFHTTLSDGTNTPEEMVDFAVQNGVRLLACTEHDIINREVSSLLDKRHRKTDIHDGELHQQIDSVDGVEVSVGHIDWAYKKSLHITAYSRVLSEALDPFLMNIREGKARKWVLRCQILADHGFQMLDASGVKVWFFLETILARFPNKRKDSINNIDIQFLIHEVPENYLLASKITGIEITSYNFLRDCLKRDWRFTKIISLPEDTQVYEPTLESLIWEVDQSDTVVSLPHANVSFRTIEEMEWRIWWLVNQGLNAIEINKEAPKEWVESIYRVRKKYGLLMTFGSDSHGLERMDSSHGKFGTLNSHIETPEYWKDKFLEKTYGSIYSPMV